MANGRVSEKFAAEIHLRLLTRRRTAWRWFSIRMRQYNRTVSTPSGTKIAEVFFRQPRKLTLFNRRCIQTSIHLILYVIILLSHQTTILSSNSLTFSSSAVSANVNSHYYLLHRSEHTSYIMYKCNIMSNIRSFVKLW